MRAAFLAACLFATAVYAPLSQSAEQPRAALPDEGFLGDPVPITTPALLDRVGAELLQRQYETLAQMRGARVQYAPNGTVRHLSGRTGIFVNSSDWKVGMAAPAELLNRIGPLLLAAGGESVRIRYIDRDPPPPGTKSFGIVVRFVQHIHDRPVRSSTVNVAIDPGTGEVTWITSNFLPDRGLAREPKITGDTAKQALLAELANNKKSSQDMSFIDQPALAYSFEEHVGGERGGGGRLVWVVPYSSPGENWEATVDALDGKVLSIQSTTLHSLNRQIGSAEKN